MKKLLLAAAIMMLSTLTLATSIEEEIMENIAIEATMKTVPRCAGMISVVTEKAAKLPDLSPDEKRAVKAYDNAANGWAIAAAMMTLAVGGDEAEMRKTSKKVQVIMNTEIERWQNTSVFDILPKYKALCKPYVKIQQNLVAQWQKIKKDKSGK